MITLNHINFVYLTAIVVALGDFETETINDLGIREAQLEQMTTMVGAMHTGDKVIAGDAVYSVMTNTEGHVGYYRTEPHNRAYPKLITLGMMITEWAYCWWDAAPPTIMTPAEVEAICEC